MAYITIEEVADRTGLTKAQIYESRKRKEWPGSIGVQAGRRLRFDADLIDAGPQPTETTNDPTVAILWAVDGIHKTLRSILREISKLNHPTITTTTGDDDE